MKKQFLAGCTLVFALGYVGNLYTKPLSAEECFQLPAYQDYAQAFVETGWDEQNDMLTHMPTECREIARLALLPVGEYIEYEDAYTVQR